MKKKFNIKNYIGKYVMNCDTEEKAKIFCNYLHSIGKKWAGGESFLEINHWNNYNKETCYCFNKSSYAYGEFYERKDYTILSFDDFDWNETKLISLVELSQMEVKPKNIKYNSEKYSLTKRGFYKSENFKMLQSWVSFENFNEPVIEIIEDEVLDKVEKSWLGVVVNPFRDRIECIIKYEYKETECISIELIDSFILLPDFKKGTMYKGMEIGKEYSLEELKL